MRTITTLHALKSLVDYNWHDELKDFVESTDSDGPQPQHVFLALQKLNVTFELGYHISSRVHARIRAAHRARITKPKRGRT